LDLEALDVVRSFLPRRDLAAPMRVLPYLMYQSKRLLCEAHPEAERHYIALDLAALAPEQRTALAALLGVDPEALSTSRG
jgi:hypothetical protein